MYHGMYRRTIMYRMYRCTMECIACFGCIPIFRGCNIQSMDAPMWPQNDGGKSRSVSYALKDTYFEVWDEDRCTILETNQSTRNHSRDISHHIKVYTIWIVYLYAWYIWDIAGGRNDRYRYSSKYSIRVVLFLQGTGMDVWNNEVDTIPRILLYVIIYKYQYGGCLVYLTRGSGVSQSLLLSSWRFVVCFCTNSTVPYCWHLGYDEPLPLL